MEFLGKADNLSEGIVGPTTTWESLTPFAPPHHPKRQQYEGQGWLAFVESQVSKACEWHGVPDPVDVDVQSARTPWLAYRRHRGKERLQLARRAVGVRILFRSDVTGPLALGSLSHFGLGVFVPASADQ
ncbi:MAG: type I-G CRISPR-associated protein Csb2 [Euzebya sp.]